MAGSSITVSRSNKEIKGDLKKEVILTITCASDDANGTVPNLTLNGMSDYVLAELKPIPDGATPPTAAFSAIIEDSDGAEVFDSGNIVTVAADPIAAKQPIGGHTGHPAGMYPRMEDGMVFKLVTTADHAVAANLGNSKDIVFKARLERK